MNNTFIGNIGNKYIYLIQDEKVPFYISVPQENSLAIVINLTGDGDGINQTKTDQTAIAQNINNIYSKFQQDNIAVVTPVIDNGIMAGVKENTDPQYASFLNKAIGYLINKAYGVLKQNGKEIYKQIKLNNNEEFRAFNERFASMYPDRVELGNFDAPPAASFVNQTNIPQTVIAPDANAIANTTDISLEDAYKESEELEKPLVKKRTKEPGFVSYVLLGVIVAVLSLIGLYLLL